MKNHAADIKDLMSLTNIGKVTAEKLIKIGISSKEEFLKQDPYDTFDKLLEIDQTLCRCALAGIVGAYEGKRWHTITKRTACEFEKLHPGWQWKNC